MSQTKSQNRLGGLDMFRFLLCGIVVFFHFWVAGPSTISPDLPYIQNKWLNVLHYGVHTFFMISGFAIMYTIKGRTGSQFAIARLGRIWPALAICALITFVGTRGFDAAWVPGLRQWFLSTSLFPLVADPANGVDWAYWTLTFEIRFYLLVMLALMTTDVYANRLPLLAGWLAISVSDVLFPGNDLVHFVALDYYSGCFIIGALTYMIWESRGSNRMLAWAMLPVAFWLMTQQLHGENAVRNNPFEQIPNEVLTEWLAPPITWALLVGSLLASGPFIKWPWLGRLAVTLGAITFPLYLVHQMLGYRIIGDLVKVLPDTLDWTATWIALATATAIAVPVALYWEPFARRIITGTLNRIVSGALTFAPAWLKTGPKGVARTAR